MTCILDPESKVRARSRARRALLSLQLVKKLTSFLLTMLAAMVLVFLVLQVLPGDPALVMLGPDAQPDTLAALPTQLGLDEPMVLRFASWVWEMAHGDLGISYAYRVPVSGLVLDRLAVTLPLALIAIAITIVLSLAMGVYAATNNH